jgi:Ca2+:H+ antiporter
VKAAFKYLQAEWPLVINWATTALFLAFGDALLNDLEHPIQFAGVLLWLLAVILVCAFWIVRHAERLATELGEPLGTLVLTLAITCIEVTIIVSTMSAGDGTPTLARDAMFAVIMIILNGMVSLTLILGALKYHEQEYNLQGASSFLAVIIPLAVIGLVVPNFTRASQGQTFSSLQAVFLTIVSLALYSVFLMIQNVVHKAYFPSSSVNDRSAPEHEHEARGAGSILYHIIMLLAYIGPVLILSKQLAVPIEYTIRVLHAPVATRGSAGRCASALARVARSPARRAWK